MNRNIVKRVMQVLLSFIIVGVILFLTAWTVRWLWAWVLVAANTVILAINFLALPREVIEERGRKKENVKKWDRILSAISIIPSLGIYAVAGLDYRFYWSIELDGGIHAAALLLYFLGSMLVTWAMVSNRFFSTMVRLQTDRGHHVATGGPYRFVRHPGYVGFILSNLMIPLILGSLYGLIASAVSVSLLVIRAGLEDGTLKAELEGYAEYARNVRYRLLPYIW